MFFLNKSMEHVFYNRILSRTLFKRFVCCYIGQSRYAYLYIRCKSKGLVKYRMSASIKYMKRVDKTNWYGIQEICVEFGCLGSQLWNPEFVFSNNFFSVLLISLSDQVETYQLTLWKHVMFFSVFFFLSLLFHSRYAKYIKKHAQKYALKINGGVKRCWKEFCFT